MSFVAPKYSRNAVDKAGTLLCSHTSSVEEFMWAFDVLSNWRAAHGYPINTFQSTLRSRLKTIDKNSIVAERLKRTPSIIVKLERFEKMKLSRMQDIGGLRAIVRNVAKVRELEERYREGQFEHTLENSKDYISRPKPDGYRCVHLMYRYVNKRAPQYNGLHVELQIRTKLQHAWATAVETMGTFLKQALKSGLGEEKWRRYFAVVSAGFASIEKTPTVPGYEGIGYPELCVQIAKSENELHVLEMLRGFAIATNSITEGKGQGSYHLVVLNLKHMSVHITPYPMRKLEQANNDYTEIEQRAHAGEPVEAVLVSAGPIKALKKAYPNYFLDTHDFIKQVKRILDDARKFPLLGSI